MEALKLGPKLMNFARVRNASKVSILKSNKLAAFFNCFLISN